MARHTYHCGKDLPATDVAYELHFACGIVYGQLSKEEQRRHHWDRPVHFFEKTEPSGYTGPSGYVPGAQKSYFGYSLNYYDVACQECLHSGTAQLWLLAELDTPHHRD